MSESPDFILYAQHGWADTHHPIAKLAEALKTPNCRIITPNLGWLRTFYRIEPLIKTVETVVGETLATYPTTPMRIIGHSMGGLIWLEVLHRHPEWQAQIHSLVLVASPVGGADLARIFDPFQWGVGIARDLGINRRQIAESLAAMIPTLMIAGDSDQGSDSTISVECTRFNGAQFVCLPGLSHAVLRNHPQLIPIIRDFWDNPVISPRPEADLTDAVIQRLQALPAMTAAHRRDFLRAQPYLIFKNGMKIRVWKNLVQVHHVFIENPQGICVFCGFVGWQHTRDLYKTLQEISEEFKEHLTESKLVFSL